MLNLVHVLYILLSAEQTYLSNTVLYINHACQIMSKVHISSSWSFGESILGQISNFWPILYHLITNWLTY